LENILPDKFRTIHNFLKRKTDTTRKKNLDLIAWLIDFNPRPYNLYRKPNAIGSRIEVETEPEKKENNGGDSGIDIDFEDDPSTKVTISKPEPIPDKEKKIEDEVETEIEKGSKYKKWILGIMSLITISVMCFYGMHYFSDNEKTDTEKKPLEEKNLTNTDKKCMAWAETEYILADCSDEIHPEFATTVQPYDASLFKNLKKVNVTIKTPFFNPNTKTPLIWYYRLGKGKFEYYKSYGLHPIYNEPLDPITQGHIDNYVPKYENDPTSFVKE